MTEEILPTIWRVELINKKEFAKAKLDENVKTFIVHVASLTSKKTIYPDWEVQIVCLLAKHGFILEKYLDFADVFSKKSAEILPKHTRINEYAIELQEDNQLSYNSIYSLDPVELETLKNYIKTNLTNNFI